MRRRDVSKVLLATAGGAALLATRAQAQTCTAPCYERTAAEIAAGVTPVNYAYAPGDFPRYGASPSASAATNADAIIAAQSANHDLFCTVAGTYAVNKNLDMRDNQSLTLSPGVVLKSAASFNWGQTGIINIVGRTNVTIIGGIIDGNKSQNATGAVYGVRINASTNVRIFGTRCINCADDGSGGGGDGFFVEGDSADIDFNSVVSQDNVRQGMSLIQGQRIHIIGGSFLSTSGNNPGAGIDLEPNSLSNVLRDITITGATLASNERGIIVSVGAKFVTISGCNFVNNRNYSIGIGDGCTNVALIGNTIAAGSTSASSPVIKVVGADHVTIVGNTIAGAGSSNEQAGVYIQDGCDNVVLAAIRFAIRIGTVFASACWPRPHRPISSSRETSSSTASVRRMRAFRSSIASTMERGRHREPCRSVAITLSIRAQGAMRLDIGIGFSGGITGSAKSSSRVEGNTVIGVALSGSNLPYRGTIVWNPVSLADTAGETSAAITVNGAAFGDAVEVAAPYDLAGITCNGYISALDTVRIRIQNETGGAIDLASGTWIVKVNKLSA